MAIHVTKNVHHIEPSLFLQNQLSHMLATAAYAKSLGYENLYNTMKNKYFQLADEFDRKADAEAKRNTHINWLGGGDSYIVTKANSWNSQWELIYSLIMKRSTQERMDLLISQIIPEDVSPLIKGMSESEKQKWISLYIARLEKTI